MERSTQAQSFFNSGINLLPPELLTKNKGGKVNLLNRLSVIVLLILFFLTSIVLTLRIVQKTQIAKFDASLAQAQSQVSDLKDKESVAILLKSRLTTIQSQISQSKKTAIFNLITALAPAGIQFSLISVERNGNASLSVTGLTIDVVDTLTSNLIDPEKNLGLIDRVEVENLSKGKDGLYRVSLKVYVK